MSGREEGGGSVHDERPFGAPTCALGFDETFEAYYPLMVRALTAACGDAEVAADATQEAFLHAHLRWRMISRYEDPVGWVRRVAINRIRDHFRRETRGAKVLVVLAADPQWIDGPSPPDDAAALLAKLPPQQRIAMSLYYIEGLSVAEVASAMSLSTGAVKFHLNQGRERLRPTLVGTRDG